MPQAMPQAPANARSGAGATLLAPPRPAGRGSEFAPLLKEAKGQGLLERRTAWYARGIAVNLLALAVTVTAMALTGDTWWTLLYAVPLAVFWARTAFFGHDAGHAQITAAATRAAPSACSTATCCSA